jgi:hypothetical protein
MEFNSDPCVVQFLHPGNEHSKVSGISWNEGNHLRKFMRTSGSYKSSISDNTQSGDIVFWGEWEPPAKHLESLAGTGELPNNLFQPFPPSIENYEMNGLEKDTDPYIFNEQFLYGICQQSTDKDLNKLKTLPKGSVILFGSKLNNKFVLDTVFVVEDSIRYSLNEYQQILDDPRIPEMYEDVFFKRLRGDSLNTSNCPPEDSTNWLKETFTLYFGANPDRRVNGMFSFFPCQTYKGTSKCGFPRPPLNLKGVSQKMPRGYKHKFEGINDSGDIKAFWKRIIDKLINQYDLKLGINATVKSNLSKC